MRLIWRIEQQTGIPAAILAKRWINAFDTAILRSGVAPLLRTRLAKPRFYSQTGPFFFCRSPLK